MCKSVLKSPLKLLPEISYSIKPSEMHISFLSYLDITSCRDSLSASTGEQIPIVLCEVDELCAVPSAAASCIPLWTFSGNFATLFLLNLGVPRLLQCKVMFLLCGSIMWLLPCFSLILSVWETMLRPKLMCMQNAILQVL